MPWQKSCGRSGNHICLIEIRGSASRTKTFLPSVNIYVVLGSAAEGLEASPLHTEGRAAGTAPGCNILTRLLKTVRMMPSETGFRDVTLQLRESMTCGSVLLTLSECLCCAGLSCWRLGSLHCPH